MSIAVIGFDLTALTKRQVIEALSIALERGDLRILPDPVLVSELQAYQVERLPSGMLRYSAPPGQHDDTVMALALAWRLASTPGLAFGVAEG